MWKQGEHSTGQCTVPVFLASKYSSTVRRVLWPTWWAQSKRPGDKNVTWILSAFHPSYLQTLSRITQQRLSSLLLGHFNVSSKMKPDKQHTSRNCRHTYWARISTTPHVERSTQTAAQWERHRHNLKQELGRFFVRSTFSQAEFQNQVLLQLLCYCHWQLHHCLYS